MYAVVSRSNDGIVMIEAVFNTEKRAWHICRDMTRRYPEYQFYVQHVLD